MESVHAVWVGAVEEQDGDCNMVVHACRGRRECIIHGPGVMVCTSRRSTSDNSLSLNSRVSWTCRRQRAGTLQTSSEPADVRHPARGQAMGYGFLRLAGLMALPCDASIGTWMPPRTCMGPCLKLGAGARSPAVVAFPPVWPQGSAAAMERVTEAGTTCGPELGLQPEGACTCIKGLLEQLAWTTCLRKQAAWRCQA